MIIKSTDKHNNLIEFNQKNKAQRYKINGQVKKGCTTTIDARFSGGGLLWWAENCVYEGLLQELKAQNKPVDVIDDLLESIRDRVKKIKNSAAKIGTNFHNIAADYALGKNPPEPETEPLITMYNKFKTYWDQSGFKVVYSEKTIYSSDLDLAGTCDLVVTKDDWKDKEGKPQYALLDMKTSKDFYVNHVIQIHGYKKMIEDSFDINITKLGLLNIPKEPNKSIEMRWYQMRPMYLKALKACHYIAKVEAKFKDLENERIKQKAKRRPNGKQ